MIPIFNIVFTRKFFKAIAVWLLYSLAVGILTSAFTPFFILKHIVYFTVAFVILSIFKEQFIYAFEKTMFYLALIGLFFWLWLLFSPDLLIGLAESLNISGEMERNSAAYYNFIVYTVEVSYYPEFIARNRGFTFEPGPYSIYLSIALTFYLIRVGLRKALSFRFIILIVSLISTLSTTGFLALGITLIYLSFAGVRGIRKVVYVGITAGIFIYAFYTFDIFYNKIASSYESGINVEETLSAADKKGQSISGGRFGGIILGWQNLKRYPLFGIGGSSELSYGRLDVSSGVYIVNGIGNIISTYGLFGILIYLYYLYKSSKLVASLQGSNVKYAFFSVFIISSFSFSLHLQVMLFTLVFLALFINPPVKAV